METRHFLLVGGTGAGKTSILQTILGSAIKRGDRILVVDPKGDLLARLPTTSFAVLSIDDARSERWNICLDVTDAGDAAELAKEMIEETAEPFWSSASRLPLAAGIERMQLRLKRNGRPWDWGLLERLLTLPLEEFAAFVAKQSPRAASMIDVTSDGAARTAASVSMVLSASALPIVSACAAMGRGRRNGFSVREWMDGKGPQVLVVRQSARYPERSASIIRIILKTVADTVAQRAADSDPAPLWLALDELAQIGRTAAVPRLAAVGRSAGVRIVAAVQSPSQLRDIYGENGARDLLDNLGTKIVGRIAPGETAAEISEDWIGERTVAWWEGTEPDAAGHSKPVRTVQDVPVVPTQVLTGELGLTRDPSGRPVIKALVIGHDDIAMLDWPIGSWPVRRAAVEAVADEPAT